MCGLKRRVVWRYNWDWIVWTPYKYVKIINLNHLLKRIISYDRTVRRDQKKIKTRMVVIIFGSDLERESQQKRGI